MNDSLLGISTCIDLVFPILEHEHLIKEFEQRLQKKLATFN